MVSGGFGNIKHIKECLSILNVSGFSIGSSIHYKFLENNIKKIKSQKFSEGNTEFIKNFYNYFKGTTHELKFISKQLEKI